MSDVTGGVFVTKECKTGIIKNTNSPEATAENGRKSQNYGPISEFPVGSLSFVFFDGIWQKMRIKKGKGGR